MTTNPRFDVKGAIRRLKGAAGRSLRRELTAYVGDGEGNVFAEEDTDIANSMYIRFDPESLDHTYALFDVTKNKHLYKHGLAIRVRPYHEDKPGQIVRWVVEGSDEVRTQYQFGADPDPADGYDGAVNHGHTGLEDGGKLDAGAVWEDGTVVPTTHGGTGNNLPSVANDGVLLSYDAGTQQVEPAYIEWGRLLVGRQNQKPHEIEPNTEGNILRVYYDGINDLLDWESAAPEFDAAAIATGELPVERGGTGRADITLDALLMGNGTDPMVEILPGSDGDILRIDGSSPAFVNPEFHTDVLVDGQLVVDRGGTGSDLSGTGPGMVFQESNGSTLSVVQCVINSGAPGGFDDIDAGFNYFSKWINSSDDTLWICTNPASGAAVWRQVT